MYPFLKCPTISNAELARNLLGQFVNGILKGQHLPLAHVATNEPGEGAIGRGHGSSILLKQSIGTDVTQGILQHHVQIDWVLAYAAPDIICHEDNYVAVFVTSGEGFPL